MFDVGYHSSETVKMCFLSGMLSVFINASWVLQNRHWLRVEVCRCLLHQACPLCGSNFLHYCSWMLDLLGTAREVLKTSHSCRFINTSYIFSIYVVTYRWSLTCYIHFNMRNTVTQGGLLLEHLLFLVQWFLFLYFIKHLISHTLYKKDFIIFCNLGLKIFTSLDVILGCHLNEITSKWKALCTTTHICDGWENIDCHNRRMFK